MPRQRKTIAELELLSELLDRLPQARERAYNERYDHLLSRFGDAGADLWAEESPEATRLLERLERGKTAVNKVRRRLAAKEMLLLREEALPGMGRQAERDRIRRTLQPFKNYQERLHLRNLKDPGDWFEVVGIPYDDYIPSGLPEGWGVLPEGEFERLVKIDERRAAAQIGEEKLRRKMAPILKLMSQKKMDRRDVLRLFGGGLGKMARMTPTGAAVEMAVKSKTAGMDPLVLKFLKAIVSRRFHGR